MRNPKTVLSAGAVVLALFGLALTALSMRPAAPVDAKLAASKSSVPEATPKTTVIRRTVRIVRHAKSAKSGSSQLSRGRSSARSSVSGSVQNTGTNQVGGNDDGLNHDVGDDEAGDDEAGDDNGGQVDDDHGDNGGSDDDGGEPADD